MAKTTPKSSKTETKSSKASSAAGAIKKGQKPMTKKASPPKKGDKKSNVSKPVSSSKATPLKAAVKSILKATVKSATKIVTSKPGVIKGGAKPTVEKVVAKSPSKPSPVGVSKKVADSKGSAEKSEKKETKKAATAVATSSASPISPTKAASKTPPKKKNADKKEEFALEDDLVGETDDFVSDELSEYQAELESAEEDIEEKEVVIEETTLLAPAPVSTKDKDGDIVLTDAEGRRYCRVKDCDQVETVDGYCRFHYLLLWKRIQVRKKILTDGKLERYVEELTARYPDKFLEVIRRDLRSEKDFISAIQEMEIDESSSDNDFEDESSNFIDEVRGASTESLVEDDEY